MSWMQRRAGRIDGEAVVWIDPAPDRTEPGLACMSATDPLPRQLSAGDAADAATALARTDTARGPRDLPATVGPVTMDRVADALDYLNLRYLTDADGRLIVLWDRYAVLYALAGPADEILMMRGRPHATVPAEWADRAYRAVNEWNHTRRFGKAYVGDPNERGDLSLFAEVQVPLLCGVHDGLLMELVDCAAMTARTFVDWLYDEGALL